MDNINALGLRRLDLNSLVVLHSLLQTASVSLTARQLCLGQPAVSHVLKHLRELLGDPLLYRYGRGMRLSPYGESLKQPLADWLNQAQEWLVARAPVAVAGVRRCWRVAMPDLLESWLLPDLVSTLQARAPGISLAVIAMPASAVEDALESGTIDAAVGYFPSLTRPLSRAPLLTTDFLAFFDRRPWPEAPCPPGKPWPPTPTCIPPTWATAPGSWTGFGKNGAWPGTSWCPPPTCSPSPPC